MADSSADPEIRQVYLLQHGEAVPKSEDPERPLSANGWATIERMAEWMAGSGLKVDQIRHSGKLRARQTATIFMHLLHPREGIAVFPGLGPDDDPQPVAQALAECPCSVMLVGHLPFLGRLAGLLLCGDSEQSPVEFHKGGIVTLRRAAGRWSVACCVPPELLPKAS